MIERDLSDTDGIIIIRSSGRWTPLELSTHFDALRSIIEHKRNDGEPIRVLSDVTAAGVQEDGIGALILAEFRKTYRRGDRVAILAVDASTKMVVRQMLQDFDMAAFNSRLPAEMWLMTDDLPPPR